MQEKTVLIILINYFNEEETASFARTLVEKQSWTDREVVIVNNGSHDPSRLEALAGETPGVHFFPAEGNLGYLPGAAFGLKKYLESGHEIPGFVILSNSDIDIPDERFLETLVTDRANADYDILGPDVWSSLLHHHQNPFMADRIPVSKLRSLLFLSSSPLLHYMFITYYYGKSRLMARLSASRQKSAEIIPVYGIHGCFMIFSRSFFRKGGTLDYPFPLFGEEIHIAELALAAGMRTGFNPGLKVIHHEHRTTGIYKSRTYVGQLHSAYRYMLSQRLKH
jgi:GT2 family glycosyltransferase